MTMAETRLLFFLIWLCLRWISFDRLILTIGDHSEDIGDPFLEEDPSNANLPSLNDPSTEPTPGTASSSEPPATHGLESSDMNENVAIASPPGSPITS
jgi:hypothetical protein